MKTFIALFLFLPFTTLAQNDSLEYNWSKESNAVQGFYSSYSDFFAHKTLHTGPFTIKHGMIECRFNLACHFSNLYISSQVKSEIFPLDIKYVYDGNDLFVIFNPIRCSSELMSKSL